MSERERERKRERGREREEERERNQFLELDREILRQSQATDLYPTIK